MADKSSGAGLLKIHRRIEKVGGHFDSRRKLWVLPVNATHQYVGTAREVYDYLLKNPLSPRMRGDESSPDYHPEGCGCSKCEPKES